MRTLSIGEEPLPSPPVASLFRGDRPDAATRTVPADAPLGLRLQTFLRRRAIDRQLATGCAMTSPQLALRAGQLTDPRARRELAGSIRGAVRSVERGADPIMLQGLAVKYGRAALRDLADQLELARYVTPRGVLLARRLMTDDLSPLYNPGAERTVTELAREIQEVLLVHPAAEPFGA